MNLIALYTQPEDAEAFEEAYFNTHLPLIRKVPGLQSLMVTRFNRTFAGKGYYLMTKMVFADLDALKTAMKSQEMAAAGENLDSFAKGGYTLLGGNEEPWGG